MELAGPWRAATADDVLRRRFPDPELDDDGWEPLDVPGHWRSCAAFATSDGPLFYRRTFETPEHGAGGPPRRAWLDFEGLFYQGDVWLDGSYLGDTEGYFVPHSFEVTEALAARHQHTLAVEVTCSPPADPRSQRNLTGVFQHGELVDPAWNPGGIWAPVRVRHTGPVRISGLKLLCPEARPRSAVLDLEAELDSTLATTVSVTTTISRQGRSPVAAAPLVERVADETLSAGHNRVRWRLTVEQPHLWWPHALGDQPLHEVLVRVDVGGERSDEARLVTGLRQVRMRDFVATVNGERLFLKGATLGPPRRELAEATAAECEADVGLARDAGLDLVRLQAHVGRPETYEAADRAGMLIWQDLPLQGGYANVRRQAQRQARAAVRLLGHHPSVAIWCGHDEPFSRAGRSRTAGEDAGPGATPAGGGEGGRLGRRLQEGRKLAGRLLPSSNRTILDGSIHRALERSDGSRPAVAASGVLPHPVRGTDAHLSLGWRHGDERDLAPLLARLPVLARFVGQLGAQAVPDTAAWMAPESWPDLDWEDLEGAHGLDKTLFDRHVPPAAYPSFDSWREATQAYQARVLRRQIETLRRLKYRPAGGFCQSLLADAQPAVTSSVLDHERRPKAGYRALAEACAPVVVVADRPAVSYRAGQRMRLALHAVSDLRVPLASARATATLSWPGGRRTWSFAGDVPADSCTRIGDVDLVLPAPPAGAGCLELELQLTWVGEAGPGRATNHYCSELGS